jgi:hypothetical protein
MSVHLDTTASSSLLVQVLVVAGAVVVSMPCSHHILVIHFNYLVLVLVLILSSSCELAGSIQPTYGFFLTVTAIGGCLLCWVD